MSSDALLNAALSVAKRLNGHIRALFVQPHPDAAFAYLPDVILAAGVTREVIERETLEAKAAAKSHFAEWRKRNEVPEAPGVPLDSCFVSWSERLGDVETVVACLGRVSDLIVVQRPTLGSVQGQRCFDAAVFEGARRSSSANSCPSPSLITSWLPGMAASRQVGQC